MYYSVHVKSVFDLAKKTQNIICLNYKNDHFEGSKRCVLLDFIERDDAATFEKKVDLYFKDLASKDEEKIMKLDVSQIQNFIVTSNNMSLI